jgi:hypothetical protein
MDGDNASVLAILIKFGLDDAAASQASAEIEKLKNQTQDDTAATAKNFEGKRELRRALEELNRVFPGLGTFSNLAAAGFREMSTAEGEAKISTEALIASFGPIAIVLLSVMELVQLWNNYKEAVKQAAAETQKSLQDTMEASINARKAQEDFNKSMEDGKGPIDAINSSLKEQLQIIEGIAKQQEAIAKSKADKDKIEQDAEKAKIQAQKDAFNDYGTQQTSLLEQKDKLLTQQKTELEANNKNAGIQSQIADLQSKIVAAQTSGTSFVNGIAYAAPDQDKIDELNKRIADLTKQLQPSATSDAMKALQASIDNLNKKIEDLQNKRNDINQQIATAQILANPNLGYGPALTQGAPGGPTAAQRAQSDFSEAGQLAVKLSEGVRLSPQEAANWRSIIDALLGHKASQEEAVAIIAELTNLMYQNQARVNAQLEKLTQQIAQQTNNRQ